LILRQKLSTIAARFNNPDTKGAGMNKELERIIMTAGDLPTIPVVATKVMQMIEDPESTAEGVARTISADPAVAARVLKIANSSFYGCQRQIQTLPHAIMILGFSTLKSLVVAASVKQVYHPFGLTEKLLWEHSFGAGLAARIIAHKTRIVNEEEAFLGGLFHDIGKIIMNFMDPDKFKVVMQLCYNDGISFEAAEKQVFPYSHEEVGALVIKKWNFPDHMMKVIMEHHRLQFEPEEDPYLVNLTAVVGLANLFCHRFGIGSMTGEEEIDLAASAMAKSIGLNEETMAELLDSFKEAYDQNQDFFS
jgi:putative nucleotidyltransferase with HDIG domain